MVLIIHCSPDLTKLSIVTDDEEIDLIYKRIITGDYE